jgi:peptide/nickel transport system permease protein
VGGIVNQAIMRTVDVFYAFPSVLLAIAIRRARRRHPQQPPR